MNQPQNIVPFEKTLTPPVEGIANFYKASGDSTRLEILRVLRNESFGVQELAFIFKMAQPRISHHLKVLTKAELIKPRRQGNTIFYRRVLKKENHQHQRMITNLFLEVDNLSLSKEVNTSIKEIHQKRSKTSQIFFEKNANHFMEKQGKLCDLKEYLSNMLDMLDLANLSKNSKVLEVGPGHGGFLRELSGRYSNLVALDRSEQILAVAKKQMTSRAEKITFICEPFESYELQSKQSPYDIVILNMVLHHMPSPANVFHKAMNLISDHGYLMIADLSSHQQEWVKKSCGDTWLGFAPEELEAWAMDAGFKEKQSLYLGLKNGFQIQLKLFQNLNV